MKIVILILLSISLLNILKGQELIWEVETGAANLDRIEYLPDGKRFINNYDGIIQVRSLEDGSLLDSIVNSDKKLRIFKFSKYKTKLILTGNDTTFYIYNSKLLTLEDSVSIKAYDITGTDFWWYVAFKHKYIRYLEYDENLNLLFMYQEMEIVESNSPFSSKRFSTRIIVEDITNNKYKLDTLLESGSGGIMRLHFGNSFWGLFLSSNGNILLNEWFSSSHDNSEFINVSGYIRYLFINFNYKEKKYIPIDSYSFSSDEDPKNRQVVTNKLFDCVFDSSKKIASFSINKFNRSIVNINVFDLDSGYFLYSG